MSDVTLFLTWSALTTLVMLALLAMPYVATQLTRTLEADRLLMNPRGLHHVGAIVVLGGDFCGHAPEMGGETVGPLTLQRLHYAARLYRHTSIPLLVTGGVMGRNGRPLAENMADVLAEDFNVVVRWIECGARNTRDNARNSEAILAGERIGRICLVTHGWHMARARKAFERVGLEVVAAPTLCSSRPEPLLRDFVPSAVALSRSFLALHEWIGRAWYKLLLAWAH